MKLERMEFYSLRSRLSTAPGKLVSGKGVWLNYLWKHHNYTSRGFLCPFKRLPNPKEVSRLSVERPGYLWPVWWSNFPNSLHKTLLWSVLPTQKHHAAEADLAACMNCQDVVGSGNTRKDSMPRKAFSKRWRPPPRNSWGIRNASTPAALPFHRWFFIQGSVKTGDQVHKVN